MKKITNTIKTQFDSVGTDTPLEGSGELVTVLQDATS